MPHVKRERRERTDNYHLLREWCRTPEQRLYEEIRPITLFGVPPAERAQETGLVESSLRRAAAAFDTHGMISLFRPRHPRNERIIIDRSQSRCANEIRGSQSGVSRFHVGRDCQRMLYPV